MSHALVLAGAVAKGAFEAGAVARLAEEGEVFSRIVGASSGALNSLVLASGIRKGELPDAAANLVKLWVEDGDWHHAFHLNFGALLHAQGLSDGSALSSLLRGIVTPVRFPSSSLAGAPKKKPVHLSVVTCALNGVLEGKGKAVSTTYEKRLSFENADFDSKAGLARAIQACVAAASFPGAFVPEVLPGLGPCADGGIVNNTPLRYALEDPAIDQVTVIAPFAARMPKPGSLSGTNLVSHLIDCLINERLFRDLKYAASVNAKVGALERLRTQGKLTRAQLEATLKILSWRRVRIRVIRPARELEAGSFSGFFDKKLRSSYVRAGDRAAGVALKSKSRE